MATTRMGDWGVIDYTPLMALVPRSQNLLEDLGIFSDANTDYKDGEYMEMERELKGKTKMHTVSRGADRQFAGTEGAEKHILQIPYATLDAITKPQEVNAFREYGTETSNATVEALVERKIAHIQRSHADYIRRSQYAAIVDNKVYAPLSDGSDSPLAKNFSTLWGKVRGTASIDFGATTTDPFAALEEGRTQIIDNAGDDGDDYAIMALVNTRQFNALVSHPLVEAAYANYPSEQEPLRNRLSGNKMNRIFRHKGVVVVEDISGHIADGKCHVLPMNMDGFAMAAFAPADTIDHVGTISQGSYLFMKENYRAQIVESELAYMAGITRPELITDVTVTGL